MASPITISVINMKGGVGKSTITALLSRHAARRNLKVLAVDLDPQANLSQAFMPERRYMRFLDNAKPSIVDVFRGFVPPTPSKGAPRRLNKSHVLVRNTTPLGGPNVQLIPSRFEFADNLVESSRTDTHALAKFLAGRFDDRDLIFIDCAPTESALTMAAYSASRFVLVPVKPEYFATIGFPLLQQSLNSFRSRNPGHPIEVLGVVINNATYDGGNCGGPGKKNSMRRIRSDSAKFGWSIFEEEIPHSRGFPKIMSGDFSWQGNAPDFRKFADEFLAKLGF